jgi:hypothetical protein
MPLSRDELNQLSGEDFFEVLLKGLYLDLSEDEKNTLIALREATGTNERTNRAFGSALIMYQVKSNEKLEKSNKIHSRLMLIATIGLFVVAFLIIKFVP